MDQIGSQLNSTDNSDFGAYLIDLLGSEDLYIKSSNRKSKTQKLLDKYQKELTKKANNSERWARFSKYLKVKLNKNKRVIVYIDGNSFIKEQIKLLEYGTLDEVANPLMRISEEEFNSDFETKRMLTL